MHMHGRAPTPLIWVRRLSILWHAQITEVCPGQHPCNRCKDPKLQRCAAWSPLAIDVCGTTWGNVFERSRAEATGYVTLSCYPRAYTGSDGRPGEDDDEEEDEGGDGGCYSTIPNDAHEGACVPSTHTLPAASSRLVAPRYACIHIRMPHARGAALVDMKSTRLWSSFS